MSFTVQAMPFAVVSAALVVLAVLAAILRGDLVVRLAFVLIAVAALPWAVGMTLGACATDLDVTLHIYRLGYAPVPVIGAGLLMVILALVGKLDSHRPILVTAVVVGLGQMIVALATDLVVRDVQIVATGASFPVAGPLFPIHVGMFAAWVGYAVGLSRRTRNWHRDRRRQPRLVIALGVLALLAGNDILLALQVVRTYPLTWVPALAATAMAIYAILRSDVLRSHGIDRAIARELIATVITGVVLLILALTVSAPGQSTVLVLASALAAGVIVVIGRTVAHDVVTPAEAAQLALDRFVDRVGAAATADEAARGLAELLEDRALAADVRVWARLEGGWWLVRGAATGPTRPFGDAIEAWLQQHGTFAVAELATERLDHRREEIEAWVRGLGADVVVPLADRDVLVGLCVGTRAAPLRDSDRVVLDEAARATARALTVLALTREVERRADLARELELAEAVRQARAVGDVRDMGGNRVAVIYQPAARVAGDLWSCVALPDDRLLVLVGDVAGRGLPAALVSAAVHGAGQTAAGLLGVRATPAAVIGMLHDTVATVDGGRHRVTAMAALVDRAGGRVEWASAGHRGGYLLHPTGDTVELHALIARGTALGEPERVIGLGERALAPGDIIVLTSDGVVEARNIADSAFGERRLQRTLRSLGAHAGDNLAQALLDAVRVHVGDAPHDDDMLFVVVGEPAR